MKIAGIVAAIALAVVVAFGAFGTGAWFSDLETKHEAGPQTGTLDLEIWSDADSTWRNGPVAQGAVMTPANWAPGGTGEWVIVVRNTGNVDAQYLLMDFKNGVASDPRWSEAETAGGYLPDAIAITSIDEYNAVSGVRRGTVTGLDYESWLPSTVANKDGILSLTEFFAGFPGGTSGQNNIYDLVTGMENLDNKAAVPAGGAYKIVFGLKFMESAGNEYQGDQFSFDVDIYVTQGPKSSAPGYLP